jgi:hypothetical protein
MDNSIVIDKHQMNEKIAKKILFMNQIIALVPITELGKILECNAKNKKVIVIT